MSICDVNRVTPFPQPSFPMAGASFFECVKALAISMYFARDETVLPTKKTVDQLIGEVLLQTTVEEREQKAKQVFVHLSEHCVSK